MRNIIMLSGLLMLILATSCFEDLSENRPVAIIEEDTTTNTVVVDEFYFGADLSYVNQILDHGGVYKVNDATTDPYKIFADKGTNLVRLRLWNNPTWTQEVYGTNGTQQYNNVADVAKAIRKSKAQGMEVLLDFHFSDTWADPAKQVIPAAWQEITSIDVLADSVYDYVKTTLDYLAAENLTPELVQIGNETNCGMMYQKGNDDFPAMNVCDGNWMNFGTVASKAILAVRETSADIKILFHVADPKNVNGWFNGLMNTAGVTDFDMIGFSYYPIWHETIQPSQLEAQVTAFVKNFGKEVIIMETAYPWTTEANDTYHNQMGSGALADYPFTPEGQKALLIDMTQSMINAGGSGIIYWEPAWITSETKDLWGTGSSWENNAFFDFDGNANSGFDFMTYEYDTNDE